MLKAPAGCTDHAEIKADPVRWTRDLVNHRRWEVVAGDLAECPRCGSSLLRLDAPDAPVGDSSVTDWSAANPNLAAAAAEVCA